LYCILQLAQTLHTPLLASYRIDMAKHETKRATLHFWRLSSSEYLKHDLIKEVQENVAHGVKVG